MSDNNEKSNNKITDKFDTIKIVIIALIAIIILPIFLRIFKEDDEVAFTVNTLSSEELAGESYTEKTTFDDSDMWETEVPENTVITQTVESIDSLTEAYVEFPIDINLANVEELMLIDGIGTVTAEKIISYRNMYGYFSDYTQLMNVDGIGEKKLDNLMNYIYISEEWLETTTIDTTAVLETTVLTTAPIVTKTVKETITVSKATVATTEETEDIVIVNEEFIDDVEDEPEYSETESKYEFKFEETTTTRYVNFPLELNTATVEELMCIDGIGEQTAQNIVNYAYQYGFYSVEDLLEVNGIGSAKLSAIMPYVYVNSYLLPPKEEPFYQESEIFTETELSVQKVNINTCMKSELLQLPGIDEALADRIITFREEIGGFLKIEELTLVEGMTNEKMSAIWNYIYI
ncbi:MAG: helix-hairpin-helix domain-containing protein [Oscillospiraceae bacterium]|nr:helix-hairpin-helix domain-containing protein [Oscillospiraceae bacterium]